MQRKRKRKGEFYTLDKKSVEKGVFFSLMNAMKLLDDCRNLLKTNSSMSSSLGLYIFALEEYGKCLLISDHYRNPSNLYKIPAEVFSDHNKKISRALLDLPQKFQRFHRDKFTTILSTDEGYTLYDDEERKITRFSPTSGYYVTPGKFTSPMFEIRMDCFHVDWDDDEKDWKINVDILSKDLERFIVELQHKIFNVFFEDTERNLSIDTVRLHNS